MEAKEILNVEKPKENPYITFAKNFLKDKLLTKDELLSYINDIGDDLDTYKLAKYDKSDDRSIIGINKLLSRRISEEALYLINPEEKILFLIHNPFSKYVGDISKDNISCISKHYDNKLVIDLDFYYKYPWPKDSKPYTCKYSLYFDLETNLPIYHYSSNMKLNYAYDINKDIVTLYDVISGKDKKFISIHWIHNNKISHIFIYDENYELYCASIYSGIFPGQYYLYYDELEWQHYISLYPYTKEKLSSSDYNHIDSYNTEENFVKLGKYYLKYVLQTLHKDSTIKKIKEKYPNGIQVMNSSWSVRDYNCQKFTIDKIFTL